MFYNILSATNFAVTLNMQVNYSQLVESAPQWQFMALTHKQDRLIKLVESMLISQTNNYIVYASNDDFVITF